jgi:hypothetical protein
MGKNTSKPWRSKFSRARASALGLVCTTCHGAMIVNNGNAFVMNYYSNSDMHFFEGWLDYLNLCAIPACCMMALAV